MIGFWQFHGKGNDRALTKLYRLGHIHFGEFWNTPWSGLSENIPFISIVTPSKLAGTVCKICPYAQFEVTGIGVRKHPHNITYAVRIVWQIWVSDSAKYGDFKQLIHSLRLKYRDQVEVIAKRRQGTLHAIRIHFHHVKTTRCCCWYSLQNQHSQNLINNIPRLKRASPDPSHPPFSKPHATKPLSAILNPWFFHPSVLWVLGEDLGFACCQSPSAYTPTVNPWLPLLAPHKIGYQEVGLPAPDIASFTTMEMRSTGGFSSG